jgi:hypothetical protein
MNLKDNCCLKGNLKILVKKNNELIKVIEKENLVVDLGLNLARDNLFSSQSNFVQWGAVSDDSNVVTASDTSLGGNEIRKEFQYSHSDTSKEFFCEYYIAGTEWSPASISTVSKAGCYFQSSGNYLFNGVVIEQIEVDETIEMILQWTFSVS